MSMKEIQKKIDMGYLYDERMKLYDHPVLRDLFLEVTSRCNARCEHCGSSCGEKIPKDEIEAEYLKKALKEIAEHYDANKILLNVTGGEPFIRKDLFDIMEYAVSLGFKWGVTSNGILIDKKMAKKIEKAKMCTISISIDGLEKTHEEFRKVPGAFKKILNGIKLLQNIPSVHVIQITTVATKKNINQLEDIYQLVLSLGIKDWRVVNCDPIGRAKNNKDILLDKEELKYLFDFIKEKRKENKIKVSYGCSHYLGTELEKELRSHYFVCITGLTIASILSNGDIFVCPNVERRKELIMGNIRKDSFVDVWENKFELCRRKRATKNDKCMKCADYKYCGGDSFHTWDFDNKEPRICLKEIMKKEKE